MLNITNNKGNANQNHDAVIIPVRMAINNKKIASENMGKFELLHGFDGR